MKEVQQILRPLPVGGLKGNPKYGTPKSAKGGKKPIPVPSDGVKFLFKTSNHNAVAVTDCLVNLTIEGILDIFLLIGFVLLSSRVLYHLECCTYLVE